MQFFKKKNKTPIGQFSTVELLRLFCDSARKDCIDELYQRYLPLIFGTCLNYLKDKEESQETTMVICSKILTNICKQDIQRFDSWLLTITRNACIQRHRNQKRERQLIDQIARIEKKSQDFVENDGFLRLLYEEDNSDKEQIQNAIAQLKTEQQECIRLFYFNKLTYGDIAEISNFSLKEVKNHLQSGKRKLKQLLLDV